jgi:hypothetical protein
MTHHWTREESAIGADAWQMVIPLYTIEKVEQGRLTLYRQSSPRPILVDINLLTANFPFILSDALARSAVRDELALSRSATAN